MATTSPDNLLTPDAGDQYALVQDLGLLADSVQDALNLRANAVIGTVAERGSFANPVDGMLWQDTDGIKMIWRYDTGSWVPAVWRWSGSTTAMNSFSAPDGFTWFNSTDNSEYVRLGGNWVGGVTDLSNYLVGVFTNCQVIASRSGNLVSLHVANGSPTPTVVQGNTAMTSALPSEFRPSSVFSGNSRGTIALVTGGIPYVTQLYIGATGLLGISNFTGADRPMSTGTITYAVA